MTMILNSVAVHRMKHYNLLLERELTLIERKHAKNVISHKKLEDTIRQASEKMSNSNRTKVPASLDHTHKEQYEPFDYHKLRKNENNNYFNQKRRPSIGGSSTNSQSRTNLDTSDEFSEDTSSFISLRRRRFCTKTQRLPPIVKASIPNRYRRENKNNNSPFVVNSPQILKSREGSKILSEEKSELKLPQLTPVQKQVRSFLETLPTYKGIQHGFDSFGPASLYTYHAPVSIR